MDKISRDALYSFLGKKKERKKERIKVMVRLYWLLR